LDGRLLLNNWRTPAMAKLDTYKNIFPHAKLAMRSIPTMQGEGTKLNYTTGTVTKRNYVQKRAGIIGARAGHQPGRGKPLQLGARAGQVQTVSPQQRRRHTGLLPEQAQEHMLVPDVPVAELLGLRQGQPHHLPRLSGQPVLHAAHRPPKRSAFLY